MTQRLLLTVGAGLCALPLLLVAATAQSPGGQLGPPAAQAGGPTVVPVCDNVTERELIVTYSLDGTTLLGHFRTYLNVYNDGTANISRLNQIGFPTPSVDQGVASKNVGATVAASFLRDLAQAGAFSACDQQALVLDVPTQTLTVLRGQPKSSSNTFSWTLDQPQVEAEVDAFVQAHFPGF